MIGFILSIFPSTDGDEFRLALLNSIDAVDKEVSRLGGILKVLLHLAIYVG